MPVNTESRGLDINKQRLDYQSLTRRNRFLHPEFVTVFMLLLSILVGILLSPFFRDFFYVLDSTSLYVEFGIIALVMTFVIISGQIDLSVASTLTLVACVIGFVYEKGIPLPAALLIGVVAGALLGLFNGFIITKFGLPPIIVTIGTLSLYRGMAQVLLGDRSVRHFPEWFVGIDMKYAGGVPVPLFIFIGLFIIMFIILNKTVFGRQVYALGTSEKAALYSGINVKRIKMILFMLSGIFSAFGGILMISRLGVARYNLAMGGELEVVTIALLGGADINGGRGNVLGTFIAFFVLVCLKTGMFVANIKIENQLTVLGFLLILSIVLSNFIYSKRK